MGKPLIDIKGQKFGRLFVIGLAGKPTGITSTSAFWKCACYCGAEVIIDGRHLRDGSVKSCGCYKGDMTTQRNFKHGMAHTGTWRAWQNMKARCLRPTSSSYRYYGGRGIKICDRWVHFKNFLADMGCRPDQTSIDRIDVEGDYEPSNCRWATRLQQMSNRTLKRIDQFRDVDFITEITRRWLEREVKPTFGKGAPMTAQPLQAES